MGERTHYTPGTFSWTDLSTPDQDAAKTFYGSEMPYMTIQTADGHDNGGIRPKLEQEPPYWLVYFGAEDVGTSLAHADPA